MLRQTRSAPSLSDEQPPFVSFTSPSRNLSTRAQQGSVSYLSSLSHSDEPPKRNWKKMLIIGGIAVVLLVILIVVLVVVFKNKSDNGNGNGKVDCGTDGCKWQSDCGVCQEGTKYCDVYCEDTSGAVVGDINCDSSTKPPSQKSCEDLPYWSTGAWGPCNNQDIQSRKVVCKKDGKIVSDGECIQANKPITQRYCYLTEQDKKQIEKQRLEWDCCVQKYKACSDLPPQSYNQICCGRWGHTPEGSGVLQKIPGLCEPDYSGWQKQFNFSDLDIDYKCDYSCSNGPFTPPS